MFFTGLNYIAFMMCPLCISKNTQFFAKKKTYSFFRCKNCKTIFLPKLPSKRVLNKYYSSQFTYNDGKQNENVIRKQSKCILSSLKKLSNNAQTICDVGSGYGYFMDEARKKGYIVEGVEPSIQLADYTFKKYQLPVYSGNLASYIIKNNNQFDIVTCIHVIEHVVNIKEFISQLVRLVKPGGVLFIETPNSDSHLLYVEKDEYTFLIPPEHLWLLSKDSIKNIIPKNARIINTSTYSFSEHFMGIIKRMIKGKPEKKRNNTQITTSFDKNKLLENKEMSVKKKIYYQLFDLTLAPLFTGILNLNGKGSILELFIQKNID